MSVKLSLIALTLASAFLGAIGQVFMKLSAATVTTDVWTWLLNWKLWAAITCYGLATILFVWALRQGNLSVLYPVVASSYIWVTLFSIFYLGEPFLWYQWVGILAIIAGIVIIVL
jgi:multidrug transporter EmrE-like cation transporter